MKSDEIAAKNAKINFILLLRYWKIAREKCYKVKKFEKIFEIINTR